MFFVVKENSYPIEKMIMFPEKNHSSLVNHSLSFKQLTLNLLKVGVKIVQIYLFLFIVILFSPLSITHYDSDIRYTIHSILISKFQGVSSYKLLMAKL